MNVCIVLTGRSYHAAESFPDELSLPEEASLKDALDALRQAASNEEVLPSSCLIAISGQHVGTIADYEERTLKDGDELLFLSPVAGG